MERILAAYDSSIFEFSPNFMKVVFKFENWADKTTSDEGLDKIMLKGKGAENGVADGQHDLYGKVHDKVHDKYPESAKNILKGMKENPYITAMQLAEQLQISERAVRKQISALKAAKVIERQGARKTGSWIVLADLGDGV